MSDLPNYLAIERSYKRGKTDVYQYGQRDVGDGCLVVSVGGDGVKVFAFSRAATILRLPSAAPSYPHFLVRSACLAEFETASNERPGARECGGPIFLEPRHERGA